MICLSKNEKGADLLTGYLAKTLDAVQMAELERHLEQCADCRGFLTVWNRLDDFAAPEVTPGFDARLYARISAEEARQVWWRRLLRTPVVPLAAAAALVALALFVHSSGPADVSKQVSIEQVAQAVDDLDLLAPIDR